MVLDEHDFREQQYEDQKQQKQELIQYLINIEDPETISFILAQENDDLSLMLSFGKELQEWKETYVENSSSEENFLLKYVKQNLITRFSIKGKRSEQLLGVLGVLPHAEEESTLGKVLKEKLKF